ncbi:MAG: alpha-amylase, partial [Pseudomonadota bacterium]|nr:alpha-amylase [Pseudomonadota bacterium]
MYKLLTAAAALAVLASGIDARAGAPSPTGWEARDKVTLAHPEWTRNAVLYQINTRQFTSEGTFAAAM